jgi:AraC family transcriptional regulator of arabinose operon
MLASQCLAVLINLLLVDSDAPEAGTSADDSVLRRAISGVREVWARDGQRPIGRHELARLATASEAHLSRVFTQTLGVPLVHAPEAVRLTHAAHLLSRSNLTVAAVAAATGFGSPYHLSRRCTALLGLPPTRLRDEAVASEALAALPAAVARLAYGLSESVPPIAL